MLGSKKTNFQKYWKIRAERQKKLYSYNEINTTLNESVHESLKDVSFYKELKTNDFKDFEMINRRILKKQPSILNNSSIVQQFAGVLKQVKSNLNN